MEERFICRRGPGTCWIMFPLILVAWGIIWLGNDLKWWDITFPLVPVIIIIIGLSILINQILAIFY